MNEEGVSEVVGAILTVLLIVTAAGIIYLMSYPVIFGGIEDVNYRSAVKTMAEIKEIVRRMKYGDEIATTKAVRVGSIHNSKTIGIEIDASSSTQHLTLRDLAIEVSGRSIVFESGVFTESGGTPNPIPVSEPDIVATDDTIYISFYNFSGSVSKSGGATLNFKYIGTTIIRNATEVAITSEFCELWRAAIESELDSVTTKPATLTDDDCSDSSIRIGRSSGDIVVVIATVEVS